MTLIRVGKIIMNFDNVTTVTHGVEPGSVIVRFTGDQVQTFTGDDAEGLLIFLDKNVKTAVKPLEDFIVQ